MERFGMLFISPRGLNLLISLRMFRMRLHHFKRPKYRLRLTQRNDNKKALFSVFRLKFCHSQVCSIRRGSFPDNWPYSVLSKPRFFVPSAIFYVPNKAQVTPSLVSIRVLIKIFQIMSILDLSIWKHLMVGNLITLIPHFFIICQLKAIWYEQHFV